MYLHVVTTTVILFMSNYESTSMNSCSCKIVFAKLQINSDLVRCDFCMNQRADQGFERSTQKAIYLP